MKKVFDEILNKLSEKYCSCYDNRTIEEIASGECLLEEGMTSGFGEAIEIVGKIADKYGNGWIPTSERMPEEEGYYLVSYGKYTQVYVEKYNGKWFDEHFHNGQPKAWTYCPDPYDK